MSVFDWIGVVLFAPLLLALAILVVYIVIGMIGSGARRRRIAEQKRRERASDVKPRPAPRQAPGD